ncbi:MAG TPA: DNA repair protein RecO [Terriglobia bacterium]|nr:DNA repair protein RecO [Terriglobia bacterium]
MPLRETEAIVLRTYRLGEADKIVSLFTRQFGRLRAVAAGAQRPKSRYGGTLEPLTYVRLWLFERENRDLLRLNSAELAESFFTMQGDYRVHLAAQYVAEVAERLLPEREVNERAFRLLLAVLRGLKAHKEIERPLIYFNYWLLRLAGFLPDFDRCAACGRPFQDEAAFCETDSLRLACSRCRAGFASREISVADVALMQRLRQLPLEKWMAEEANPAALRPLRRLLESWVERSAEKKLITRELLDQEED